MKQYRIDEIRPAEAEKLQEFLEGRFGPAELGGVFWIPLEPDRYGKVQAGHTDCQPFYFAVELQGQSLTCELLIRSKSRIRCECISYADTRQRNWIIRLLDGVFDQLGIKT